MNQSLSQKNIPRFKWQVSYLAKFIIHFVELFLRWIKSDMIFNHGNYHSTIRLQLMQHTDDEQLEGSGFQFDCISEVIFEFYRILDIKANSCIELPPKYKDSKSIINIQNEDNHCFLWCISAHLNPVDNHQYRISNYVKFSRPLNTDDLGFPVKVKDNLNFGKLHNLNSNVFELDTTITPIYKNTNYTEPQVDLLLYENHYCSIPRLHKFINKNPHMKPVCRRCITAFSTNDDLLDHIEKCIKQKPAKIGFSWRAKITFDYFHMKIEILFRVFAYFECFIQRCDCPDKPDMQNKILSKQIPNAVGLFIITPIENKYNYKCGIDCVK